MSGPPPPPRKRRPQGHVDHSRQQQQQQQQHPLRPQQPKATQPALAEAYGVYGLDRPPETSIGKGVRIQGELRFDRLLRIDGTFTGNLRSRGSVIIGPTGTFVGDMMDISVVLVDGGKINGNLTADAVIVISAGTVVGDIVCKQFSCDSNVIINGRVNINRLAPEIIDRNGEVVIEVEVGIFVDFG
jgi:cytoskeletal protein CcmA (bactofilin family)